MNKRNLVVRISAFALGAFLYVSCSVAYSQTGSGSENTNDVMSKANSLVKIGDTTGAITLLKGYIKEVPGEPSIKLSELLGFTYLKANKAKAAKKIFTKLANLPEGVNDAVKGNAALRVAYLSKGKQRAKWAEAIIVHKYKVPQSELGAAYRLAAGSAHVNGDLKKAIKLYTESPDFNGPDPQRAYIQKEMAGLYFELGKGEGKDPITTSSKAEMLQKARALCLNVSSDPKATKPYRMVAELMSAETWFFEKNFQESHDLIQDFLTHWGSDPLSLKNLNERRYINTAKTLQAQNCYAIGSDDEAVAIAKDLIENHPAKNEEFRSSDSFQIASIVLKLCAQKAGDLNAARQYDAQAWSHRPDNAGLEARLRENRSNWLNSKGGLK